MCPAPLAFYPPYLFSPTLPPYFATLLPLPSTRVRPYDRHLKAYWPPRRGGSHCTFWTAARARERCGIHRSLEMWVGQLRQQGGRIGLTDSILASSRRPSHLPHQHTTLSHPTSHPGASAPVECSITGADERFIGVATLCAGRDFEGDQTVPNGTPAGAKSGHSWRGGTRHVRVETLWRRRRAGRLNVRARGGVCGGGTCMSEP